uniref:Uncharacterized protein n=1 Tax=Pantoea phage Survivor TaxID=3232176 RepID=A0AAU8KZK7_9CAUD
MQRQIPCLVGADLVLTPAIGVTNAPNIVIALVTTAVGPDGSQTGVIQWSGAARAFLTYDMTGTRVLSYTLTDQSPSVYQSVENILRSI